MLFLHRPRETWMPFERPLHRTDQASYNRSLQRQFDSARHRLAAEPAAEIGPSPERIRADLDALLEAGALTADEHSAATERLGAS